jgi:hypothetical protein
VAGFLAVTLLRAAVAADQPLWISALGGATDTPSVKVMAADSGKVVLDVEIPGYHAQVVQRRQGRYGLLSLPGCGYTSSVGEPQLPVIRRLLEVPEGAALSVEVQADFSRAALADSGIDCLVLPRQQPVPKLPGATKTAPFVSKGVLYQTDQFTSVGLAAFAEAGHLAGRRLVMVEVAPIAYNPVQAALRVANRLTVTLKIEGGKAASSALSSRQDALLSRLALNHVPAPAAKSNARLLIIAHDSLASNLTAFVNHKMSLGWAVDVANTTTAGVTTNAIRSYIQSRYGNPATRPDALLLVGDTALIPQFISGEDNNPDTDLYYACMDAGDDWQPELPCGRLSVSSSAQLEAVVNKTILYETAPPAAWLARAALMASDDPTFWALAEGTHNWVLTNYLQPRGYVSDKLYCVSAGATSQKVREAFNEGCALGIYSGHGSEGGWAGPAFSQAGVRGLTNAGQYPFVCSFACLTGRYSQQECFAETWQRGSNYGAVEILASSTYSYWDEDDILEKKLFTALFDEDRLEFGDATLRAKYLYLLYWGPTATTRRYFEQYNLFGDPTVSLETPVFSVASLSPLPTAWVNEPYQCTLSAAGGTRPYTWSVPDGALPAGLSLDPASGTISGTPTGADTATFTVQATDAALATARRLMQLPALVRLQITTASNLPTCTVNSGYNTALQAQGGGKPYAWSIDPGGAYTEGALNSGWVGGGAAQGWRADDQSWNLALPWPFPYYGINRTSVWVCSNGYLDVGTNAATYENSDQELIANARIAPLWDDLVTTGAGDDIYITTNTDRVVVRWAAHTYSSGYPASAEAVLYRDGTIQFNYGAGQSGFSPTVGLSRGDGTHYILSAQDHASFTPAGLSTLFLEAGSLPPGLSLSPSGAITGTPTQAGLFRFIVCLGDAGLPAQTVQEWFSLEVVNPTDFPRLRIIPPADASDCHFSFTSVSGRLYRVEWCNDLSLPNGWVTLTNGIAGTGKPIAVLDPGACGQPRRYYRIRMQ